MNNTICKFTQTNDESKRECHGKKRCYNCDECIYVSSWIHVQSDLFKPNFTNWEHGINDNPGPVICGTIIISRWQW